jgi:hypothetical protein
MTKPVVDVVAEEIQKEHIAEDVQDAAVQKGITYELPEMGPGGRENKLVEPGAKHISPPTAAAGRQKGQ